jgi:putative tricarboxylic transport membrane protein
VRNRDLLFGIATFVVAVGYYGLTVTIPQSDLADPVGPQGLPQVYALLLAALSLILIARSLGSRKRASQNAEPENPVPSGSRIPNSGSRAVKVVGMLLIGVAYIIVLPWLGYLLSVAALITTTIYFQGGVINGRSILVALSGAVCLWLLFVWLLGIQYPAGLWPSVI